MYVAINNKTQNRATVKMVFNDADDCREFAIEFDCEMLEIVSGDHAIGDRIWIQSSDFKKVSY